MNRVPSSEPGGRGAQPGQRGAQPGQGQAGGPSPFPAAKRKRFQGRSEDGAADSGVGGSSCLCSCPAIPYQRPVPSNIFGRRMLSIAEPATRALGARLWCRDPLRRQERGGGCGAGIAPPGVRNPLY